MRRKFLVLLIALVALIATGVYSFVITPTYMSTVVVQFEPDSVKVLPFNAVSDSLVRASPDFELYMKTQDVLLRSDALARRALSRIKDEYQAMESSEAELPMIDGDFSAGLDIVRVSGSQIVNLNYLSYDPEFSALAANGIAEEFVRLHFERKVETTRKATEFLETQLDTIKQSVESAEAVVLQYAREHDILDTDENQRSIIRERYGSLNSDLSRAQSEFLAAQAEFAELKGVSEENLPSSLRTQEIANLETNVLSAEQELSNLLTQFGENWPEVVRQRSDLAVLQSQLRAAKSQALERERRDVQLRLNTAKGKYELLDQQFKQQEKLVHELNEATVLYNALNRDLDASEELYQGLLQRLKETGVDLGLDFGNIHITDPAKPAGKPYQPKPLWNMGLGLVVGLSAGLALAFFLDYVDSSMRSPADIEALGIPVLGWIPVLKLPRKEKLALEAASEPNQKSSKAMLSLKPSESQTLVRFNPGSMDLRDRESYRSLCASLLLSKAEKPASVILITSSIPREGKTTTAMNVGVALAETGAPTLLVDSDLRNPALSRRFGASNGRGLSVYLAGGEIEIRDSHIPNLYILPAGPKPPNPVALLTSTRFAETLLRLKQKFRFIVIDSPPVLGLADTPLIAAKTDGVILVVKASETPKEVVSRAKMHLERSGACLLGAAINHLNLRDPEYSYYSKYYSYPYPT